MTARGEKLWPSQGWPRIVVELLAATGEECRARKAEMLAQQRAERAVQRRLSLRGTAEWKRLDPRWKKIASKLSMADAEYLFAVWQYLPKITTDSCGRPSRKAVSK